jgi:hypothetical protein
MSFLVNGMAVNLQAISVVMRTGIILLLILSCLHPAWGRWNGKVYLYGELAGMREWDYSKSYLATMNTGVEYIGNPLKSFGCELNVYYYDEIGYSSAGIGLRPMTKYYLWRKQNFRVFVEVKGGVIYMSDEFPEGGSQFNFTFSGSTGADFRLTDKAKLLLAVRYNHMSNWNIYGDDNNPTWDGIGVATGVVWQIR